MTDYVSCAESVIGSEVLVSKLFWNFVCGCLLGKYYGILVS